MTPKEKAEELYEKYFYLDCKADLCTDVCADKEYSRQCALIAVDEILKVVAPTKYSNYEYYYWKQVKNEIELL